MGGGDEISFKNRKNMKIDWENFLIIIKLLTCFYLSCLNSK